jgi:hypothetical protein
VQRAFKVYERKGVKETEMKFKPKSVEKLVRKGLYIVKKAS